MPTTIKKRLNIPAPGSWREAVGMRGIGNMPVAGVETTTGETIANCGTNGHDVAAFIRLAPDMYAFAAKVAEITSEEIGNPALMLRVLGDEARQLVQHATGSIAHTGK